MSNDPETLKVSLGDKVEALISKDPPAGYRVHQSSEWQDQKRIILQHTSGHLTNVSVNLNTGKVDINSGLDVSGYGDRGSVSFSPNMLESSISVKIADTNETAAAVRGHETKHKSHLHGLADSIKRNLGYEENMPDFKEAIDTQHAQHIDRARPGEAFVNALMNNNRDAMQAADMAERLTELASDSDRIKQSLMEVDVHGDGQTPASLLFQSLLNGPVGDQTPAAAATADIYICDQKVEEVRQQLLSMAADFERDGPAALKNYQAQLAAQQVSDPAGEDRTFRDLLERPVGTHIPHPCTA